MGLFRQSTKQSQLKSNHRLWVPVCKDKMQGTEVLLQVLGKDVNIAGSCQQVIIPFSQGDLCVEGSQV